MNEAVTFLRAIDSSDLTAVDRAEAVLWFVGLHNDDGIHVNDICAVIEEAGHPAQNKSRLSKNLTSDRKRVSRVPGKEALRLHPRAKLELDERYSKFINAQPKPKASNSVLPQSLFLGTRGYIEKVVFQINASFDLTLFDCCAVMCRRLLETLIIEVYESAGRANDIKGADGNFYMFSDLLRVLLADSQFNVSRNAQQGLKDFKKLGDLSAHSRRYNAHRPDIEKVSQGVRVASEELLHLAKLI